LRDNVTNAPVETFDVNSCFMVHVGWTSEIPKAHMDEIIKFARSGGTFSDFAEFRDRSLA
jgi:hypothetical protein